MMPDMDGIVTLSRLKADIKTREIPVILLTAKTQAAEKDQLHTLGVVDVITKPFNSMTLARQIAKILHWEL
jgi:CheY-like chemotaxis protein